MNGSSDNQNEEQKFGAPPAPEVSLRTMNSDTKSVERGEPVPVPESVLPPATETEPVFRPETQPTGGLALEEEKPKGGGKGVWLAIIIAVLVVGLGLLGYFVVYPLFVGPGGPTVSPAPTPTQTTIIIPHNSLFLLPPTAESEVRLSNLLTLTVMSALQGLSATSQLNPGSIQEVAILDDQGSQIPFSSYLTAFASNLSSAELNRWFEDDFTAFLYYNTQGVWPGLIARVKTAANLDEIRSGMGAIEAAGPEKFYLSNPGTFGAFKDGRLNNGPTRYAVGSSPGAALNYGIIGNYFVLGASYDGLKAAAALLGI